jgi:hypothetical protein
MTEFSVDGEREGSDQAVSDSNGRGLTAVGDPELGQEIGDVRASSARADEQPLGDLGIGQALREQAEDLLLAASEIERRSQLCRTEA